MDLRSKFITWYGLVVLLVLGACTIPGTPRPPTPVPQHTPTNTPTAPGPSPTIPIPSPTSTEAVETPTIAPETPTPTGETPGTLPPISPENASAVQKLARVSEGEPLGYSWSPRDDWLAVVGTEGVTVYSPEEIRTAAGENPAGGSLVPVGLVNPANVFLSPGGETLAVLGENEFVVRTWDVATGEMSGTLEWTDHASPILYGVVFSPDWRILAWYARGTVQFMNLPSGVLGPTINYEEFIQAVAFSPEGDFFAAAALGTVQGEFIPVVPVWDVDAGEPFATLSGHETTVIRLQFSADGRLLAAETSEGDVFVWQVIQGQLLQVLPGHNNGVQEMVFTGDGQNFLVTSPDGSARFWDLASGELIQSWHGLQAAASPDGRLLAFQSSAGEMMLIDSSSGDELRGLETPPSLSLLDFSPQGRLLIGQSPEEPALHLWGVVE